MTRLVAFPTQDGQTVVVEVEEALAPGAVRAARPGEVAEQAAKTFEGALSTIKPAAEALIKTVQNLVDRPNEIGVSFGIKLTAQAGAIIASAGGEANFSVTLKWTAAAGHN